MCIPRMAIPVLGIVLLLTPTASLAARGRFYVALGDSVAEGVAATDYYGYVPRFRSELERLHGPVELLNVARGGVRSHELIVQARGDPAVRNALRRANVVTISVGGNNLLACGTENFAVIAVVCAESGVAAFHADWPELLAELRTGSPTSLSTTANILATTVYNPYPGDDPRYAEAEAYVERINAEIRDPALQAAYGYSVVDVHDDFAGRLPDGRWKVCAWLAFCLGLRDPHPTDAGHEEIARLHTAAYAARVARTGISQSTLQLVGPPLFGGLLPGDPSQRQTRRILPILSYTPSGQSRSL
ncbi:MAG: hypothetical protein IT307_05340 [Chloroflexi bacterium]|nr:hypothetical protein [Chloroflexota bacterium]